MMMLSFLVVLFPAGSWMIGTLGLNDVTKKYPHSSPVFLICIQEKQFKCSIYNLLF